MHPFVCFLHVNHWPVPRSITGPPDLASSPNTARLRTAGPPKNTPAGNDWTTNEEHGYQRAPGPGETTQEMFSLGLGASGASSALRLFSGCGRAALCQWLACTCLHPASLAVTATRWIQQLQATYRGAGAG